MKNSLALNAIAEAVCCVSPQLVLPEIIDVSAALADPQPAMLRLILLLLGALQSAFRDRATLVLENLALRQQLAGFAQGGRRPRVSAADRWFWIVLCSLWWRWSEVLVFVKPETVIRWHRAGFRRYWTWLSHRRRMGRPTMEPALRDLIRRMAAAQVAQEPGRARGGR